MELLQERIRREGRVLPGNIVKVDGFLNHRVDTRLLEDIADEFAKYFDTSKITVVLTAEASGIALATICAQKYGVPMLFAKKAKSDNIESGLYQSEVFSYTYKKRVTLLVSQEWLNADDHVLIIDDFMANGFAVQGLVDIVNEAGASVYSASKLAAEEFPQYDVNLRSAVSIARRLQDPLAELVKIDPKAIGVGQYQHDMPEKELDAALGGVVEACVNAVGVDLNTASAPLLKQVAGLNATTAKNIVAYREENGAFTSRAQIKKVPKLGPKAFEQCAGFLRVPESKQVLDRTGVHPESYDAAKKLAELLDIDLKNAGKPEMANLPDKLRAYGAEKAAAECGVGVPTLQDIVKELVKPGRDPRDELPAPLLRTDILELKDLKPGMKLRGTVRNVVDFGAFVDIGVHQDGLVHISRLSDNFVRKPSDVVCVGDVVDVAVVEVDAAKKRIALSMLAADVGRN